MIGLARQDHPSFWRREGDVLIFENENGSNHGGRGCYLGGGFDLWTLDMGSWRGHR